MSLILCGDPKQDQQENSILKFIMIYFYYGMQLINMISTKLQNNHRERPSSLIKINPCGDFEPNPEEEDSTNDQNQDEPSPYQSSLNSAAPKKPTNFLFPINLGESSLKLQS